MPESLNATPTFLAALPAGRAGTRATLRLMARLVKQYRTDLTIREKAASLVADIPGQAYRDEAQALFFYVRDCIRYLQDINGVETVQAPDYTLAMQFGDCDDKATLLAALLESIGHPARFIAVGFNRNKPGDFEHVYVETKIGNEWISCETTVPDAVFGWSPTFESQAYAYMRECI